MTRQILTGNTTISGKIYTWKWDMGAEKLHVYHAAQEIFSQRFELDRKERDRLNTRVKELIQQHLGLADTHLFITDNYIEIYD